MDQKSWWDLAGWFRALLRGPEPPGQDRYYSVFSPRRDGLCPSPCFPAAVRAIIEMEGNLAC
jgi:hypothetical protein